MYGTVARIKTKPGMRGELLALGDEFGRTRGPSVKGFVGGYLVELDDDPDGAMLVAIFQDKPSYLANADDPEQDKEFRRMREVMAADPEWHDGHFTAM